MLSEQCDDSPPILHYPCLSAMVQPLVANSCNIKKTVLYTVQVSCASLTSSLEPRYQYANRTCASCMFPLSLIPCSMFFLLLTHRFNKIGFTLEVDILLTGRLVRLESRLDSRVGLEGILDEQELYSGVRRQSVTANGMPLGKCSTHVRLPNSNLARVLPTSSNPHDQSVQHQGDEPDLRIAKRYKTFAESLLSSMMGRTMGMKKAVCVLTLSDTTPVIAGHAAPPETPLRYRHKQRSAHVLTQGQWQDVRRD